MRKKARERQHRVQNRNDVDTTEPGPSGEAASEMRPALPQARSDGERGTIVWDATALQAPGETAIVRGVGGDRT